MPVIATENQHYSNVVKHEYAPDWAYCKKTVVVNGPAATIAIGTVLGQVTATGKWKVCEASANDGSQVAAAVVVGNSAGKPMPTAMAATTDTTFLVMYRGPAAVSANSLTFGASVTAGALTQAAYAQLGAVGIDVLTTI
jgi:hypothetical protein